VHGRKEAPGGGGMSETHTRASAARSSSTVRHMASCQPNDRYFGVNGKRDILTQTVPVAESALHTLMHHALASANATCAYTVHSKLCFMS